MSGPRAGSISARIRALAVAGRSRSQIAQEIERSLPYVAASLQYLHGKNWLPADILPSKRVEAHPAETVTRITTMVLQGFKRSEIARRTGLTLNQVSGLIDRERSRAARPQSDGRAAQ